MNKSVMAKTLLATALTLGAAAAQAQDYNVHHSGDTVIAEITEKTIFVRTSGDTTNVATHHHFMGKKEMVGYRIQVFSDRNQRTAKGEALSKERSMKEAFPEMGTYITYDAPSWRLRVGDFRTRDEAASRLAELKELFPGYANEMIIVVDLINTAAQ